MADNSLFSETPEPSRVSPVETTAEDAPLSPLARAVREAMERRGWSLRGAQTYTGIHANTVDRLMRGQSTKTEAIIEFARRIAPRGKETDTVRDFLRLAGKEAITHLVDDVEKNTMIAVRGGAATLEEPARVLLSPGEEWVEIRGIADPEGSHVPVRFRATAENLALLAAVMRAVQSSPITENSEKQRDNKT